MPIQDVDFGKIAGMTEGMSGRNDEMNETNETNETNK